ncbi:hypothetical protein DPMN_175711 [Dreissena polymorpha]|uniref:Uncharacterized protein n=1 Tax=Dreissena polymorpha TaxID=45954 RepID=A0A9D4E9X2_DREPO|nr:hypothetical protein DPMN_175711 [Dreissena polymorpha]
MDQRMAVLEKDTKTLWLALEDRVKRVDERVSKLEHSTEGADIAVAHVSSRIDDLERERNSLREDLTNSKVCETISFLLVCRKLRVSRLILQNKFLENILQMRFKSLRKRWPLSSSRGFTDRRGNKLVVKLAL